MSTMPSRAKARLLAEIATGIGASECHHLFDLEPYGCRRRLWYEKTKHPADFPFTGNRDTERGTELEAIVRRRYQAITGHRVQRAPFCRHAEDEWLVCHLDGRILDPLQHEPGVLEIKCPNVRTFLKVKRDGLLVPWIVQAQQGMLVAGLSWADVAVHSAELWETIIVPFKADAELQANIRQTAARFWRQVENGPAPDRLFPDDRRCQTCPFRTTCQGAALIQRVEEQEGAEKGEPLPQDDTLAGLVREYVEADEIVAHAEALKEDVAKRLKDALGDRPGVQTACGKAVYRPQESRKIDPKAVRDNFPEAAKQCTRVSVSRPLRVYPS